jgi:hypothetical protein
VKHQKCTYLVTVFHAGIAAANVLRIVVKTKCRVVGINRVESAIMCILYLRPSLSKWFEHVTWRTESTPVDCVVPVNLG